MNNDTLGECQVCFENYKIVVQAPTHLICTHMLENICLKCLDNWIKEQISNSSVINYQLQHIQCPIDKYLILRAIPLTKLPNTQLQLLYNYLRLSHDIINCPNPACDYRGIFTDKSCLNPLVCNKCQHEWYEQSQLGFFNKIKNPIELLSILYKYFYTKNCPTCKIPIQKNGGCNNMTCKKCNAYFCWLCLNLNNKHPYSCGLKLTLKSFLLFSPILYNFKKYGFFKLLKEYSPIKKPQKWYQFLLYPFECVGLSLRAGIYYAFCVSLAFFLVNSGIILKQLLISLKNKIKRYYNPIFNKYDQKINDFFNSDRYRGVKFNFLVSYIILFLSGLLSFAFGSKTEYKLFLGTNVMGLSLVLSFLLFSTF